MLKRYTRGYLKTLLSVAAVFFAGSLLVMMEGVEANSPGPYALPKERFVLPNGLTVVVVEKHKLPLVHVQVMVKTGSLYEPENKAGLGNLTAGLLDNGTSGKTALEIAESLDLIGASLSVSPGKSGTTISLSTLRKDVEEGFSILTEVLKDPAFREEELERERKQVLSGFAQKKDSPRSLVRDAIIDMVYHGHAMRRPVEGYEDTVPEITREDILEFYRSYYIPGNSILVMVADMSRKEMRGMVERYFGGWKGSSAPPLKLSPPRDEIKKKVRLIDMDVNQSYVNLGMLSLKRDNPDYNALRVMNYIMGGGGFVSRLLKRIRSEEGLAYSVYSYAVPGSIFRGYYLFSLQTKTASTSRAMNLMLEIMRGMRENLVTEQELAEAKSYYEGSLARSMETYGDVAGLIINQEFFGLPDNYYLKDIEEIKGLAREDLLRVARKYIDLENFIVAIVTKIKDLQLEVEGIDESIIEKVEK